LQIRAAFSAKGENVRSLAIAWHRQGAKPQDIVIVDKAFQPALDIAVLIIKIRVQKAVCLCGCEVVEASEGKKYRPVGFRDGIC
jgi:hypothetical protein